MIFFKHLQYLLETFCFFLFKCFAILIDFGTFQRLFMCRKNMGLWTCLFFWHRSILQSQSSRSRPFYHGLRSVCSAYSPQLS